MTSDAYKLLLSKINLEDKHVEDLKIRGFDDAAIKHYGYKTWPRRRKQLVEQVLKDVKNPSNIPGFWREKGGTWSLAGMHGLAIPVRNIDGSIESIKIRSDSNDIIGKYVTLSSNPKPEKNTKEIKYPNGTAAKTSVHYPLVEEGRSKRTLVITEGELKADLVCLHMKSWYCVSLPGVGMWEWGLDAVEKIKPDQVLLAFDADKNKESTTSKPEGEPFIVAKSLSKLYLGLEDKDVNVKILDWGHEYGKGIDDVITQGFEDKIKIMSDDEAKEFCRTALKGERQFDWVWVIATKRFRNTVTGQELDEKQFDSKFAPFYKKNSASYNSFKDISFPRVDAPIYKPGGLQFIEERNLKFINLWEPSEVQPVAGDAQLFLDHVKKILPNEKEANIFLDYLAYNLVHPGVKINWSVLIQGEEGIGKSYFQTVARLILGYANVSTPSNDTLHEKYTGWAKRCSLVVVNEIMAVGRMGLMNKLKDMITEPHVTIREMNRDPYLQPNHFNFLFFTNHEDAIVIDKGDRRYCVFYSPAKPESTDYFDKLFDWTHKNIGEIYYHLKYRDLKGFRIKGSAPMTTAKESLIIQSLKPLDFWVKDCIEGNNHPFNVDIICVNDIIKQVPKYVKKLTKQSLNKAMKTYGAEALGEFRSKDGKVRLWSVRNAWKWKQTSKEKILEEYERGLTTSYYYQDKQYEDQVI